MSSPPLASAPATHATQAALGDGLLEGPESSLSAAELPALSPSTVTSQADDSLSALAEMHKITQIFAPYRRVDCVKKLWFKKIRRRFHGRITRFYEYYAKIPLIAEIVADSDIDKLVEKQLAYWDALFTAPQSTRHQHWAQHIGQIHADRGVNPFIFISSYGLLIGEMYDLLKRAGWCRTRDISALMIFCLEDIALVIDHYISSLQGNFYRFIDHHSANLEQQVGKRLEQVNTSASSLHEMAQNLEASAHLTDAALTKLAAAALLAAQHTDDVAQDAEALKRDAQNIDQQAVQGSEAAREAKLQSDRVTDAVGHFVSSAENIAKVSETIKKIAAQTDILSLNAAIEAARAGDSARGFAVVAEEIKALSGQAAVATEQISQLVIETKNSVKTATEAISGVQQRVDRAAQRMVEILQAVERQTVASTRIADHSQQAAAAVKQVSLNSKQIVGEVRRNKAVSIHINQAAEALAAHSKKVLQMIHDFVSTLNQRFW